MNPQRVALYARVSKNNGCQDPEMQLRELREYTNLLYSILEGECRIAATAMGMDCDIGMLHVDTPARASLACDLQEPIRASVDAFVLNWLLNEPFRKADFWEDRNGDCRITTPLVLKLCTTADTWRKLVSPVAERVAQELWASISTKGERLVLATRLTQSRKREAKGIPLPLPSILQCPIGSVAAVVRRSSSGAPIAANVP
jgi:hypothetical protein